MRLDGDGSPTVPHVFSASGVGGGSLPCWEGMDVEERQRVGRGFMVVADGTATSYAKSGLVGLSAASGQWCAEVYGQ